jgi:hypothetical protein
MRWIERQRRVEEKVYDTLGLLEDEFELEIDSIPEVRWFGRKGYFEDLGLAEKYREEVEEVQFIRGSLYLTKPRMILLNRDLPHHVNEETAHYFHLSHSELDLKCLNKLDWFSAVVLTEMFGFFGSKILDSSRKNDQFKNFPDHVSMVASNPNEFAVSITSFNQAERKGIMNQIIYRQAYELGDRMFFAYEGGIFSKKRIQDFLVNNFRKSGQATEYFFNLREELWPLNTP